MASTEVETLLRAGLDPRWAKVEQRQLAEIEAAYRRWPGAALRAAADEDGSELTVADSLIRFLCGALGEEIAAHDRLKPLQDEYAQRHRAAATRTERERHLLDFAAALGADRRQLRGDRAALARWFDFDALADRVQRRAARHCRRISFLLDRIGTLTAARCGQDASAPRRWARLAIEDAVQPLLAFPGDARVRVAAFRCLAVGVRGLPREAQEGALGQSTLQYVYRAALEAGSDVWLQSEAIALLQTLSPSSLATVLTKCFTAPRPDDSMFVRRRAVQVLGRQVARDPSLLALLPEVAADPSPYVRQALAEVLVGLGPTVAAPLLERLALEDDAHEVRAAALLAAGGLLEAPGGTELARAVIAKSLAAERDPFVLRVGFESVADGCARLVGAGDTAGAHAWCGILLPCVERLHAAAPALPTRRHAAEIIERVWCELDPVARELRTELAPLARGIAPGRSRRLPARLLADGRRALLPRVLSVLAQRDFPFELTPGLLGTRLRRGHRRVLRSWRVLHELRHPSPDKRQAFRHTVGRLFDGRIHVPSGILAELAQTRVPGEPLHLAEEGGWRPYLPLVDELIACLDLPPFAPPLRIYSSEGVTEVRPPASPLARLAARTRLTARFANYAQLRNWQDNEQTAPSDYVAALRALGFELRHLPHADGGAGRDPAVARFFPLLGLPDGHDLWARVEQYLQSAYENNLDHLAIFTLGALALFFGRHQLLNRQLRHARRAIPLSIGGWGTRGKSGTERLKAALFNALGYSVMAKTTGCEAMFLHCHAHGSLREMYVFRPYDKATIWEQHAITRLGADLGADVLLWECMALNPAFVELLQRRWMRDDIATLTNTFPDHEDIQGPAGIDVAETMTHFIPQASVLLTSEEEMLPTLTEHASALRTRVNAVGWLESGLIPRDVLARFPYEEHPGNVALVVALARELGIAPDYALKSMADHVVPDIGVLKVFPVARLLDRELEFSNGMSANERFGSLGNWQRLGFDRHDPAREPGVMLTTVVNNRADRVARSQVFAAMLVEDLAADRHVLIGSNLNGLLGYVREAWDEHARHLSLWPAHVDAPAPLAILDLHAARLRVARDDAAVRARLAIMLRAGGAEPESFVDRWRDAESLGQALRAAGHHRHAGAIVAHLARDLAALAEYEAFAARLASAATGAPALDAEFRSLLWRWFERKLVIVDDPHASGERVVQVLRDETPPGFRNRVMGLQNIKGTGLDFVYRWQAWDRCHRACAQATGGDPVLAREGLRTLVGFQEYGLLCEDLVRATVAQLRSSPELQQERVQAEVALIETSLDRALADIDAQSREVRATGWGMRVLRLVEDFLDAGQAVARRKTANRIYRDLVDGRISHQRAASELQTLSRVQRGGWLAARLARAIGREAPGPGG